MTQDELKKILYTIYKNIRCPSCGKKYEFGRIHVKGYFNNLCFLELQCSDHLPLYATIATPSQAHSDHQLSTIDNDYMLEAFTTLNNHSGNISELIKKK